MPITPGYSEKSISSEYYETLTVSGCSSAKLAPNIGTKGELEEGYIFVPYVMMNKPVTIAESNTFREILKRQLKNERKEKLKKIEENE